MDSFKKQLKVLDNTGFIYFSHGLSCNRDDNGILKKKPVYHGSWKEINESIFYNNDKIVSIKTGKKEYFDKKYNSNIKQSDIFVIDIDDLSNETANKLNAICENYCDWIVKTRKGFHYYFKYDERLDIYEKQTKASGINTNYGFDTRGNGGVIFFGSYDFEDITYKYSLIKKDGLKIMNDQIFDYVKLLLDSSNTKKTTDDDGGVCINRKNYVSHKNYNGKIEKIKFQTIQILISCLSNDRFLDFEKWRATLFACFNCNNDEKVAKILWERSKVGKYQNISYEEIYNQFYSNEYVPDFSKFTLYKYAREDDNNGTYSTVFGHNYDVFEGEIQKIDVDKLDYYKNKLFDDDTKLCVIKSRYGSGKTKYIEDVITDLYSKKRIIFLVMRQSLSRNICSRFENFGFKNYLNTDNKLSHKDDKIIISLNSLMKITYNKDFKLKIKPYDLVICDEFCSLLTQFDHDAIKDVEKVHDVFMSIINLSTQTYFLDGDISNREISYLQQYYDYTDKPVFNVNRGAKYYIDVVYDEKGYLECITEDLKKNKKVCLVSTSSNFTEQVYDMFNKKYKVLIVNASTDGSIKKQLDDVETLFMKYDLVIYSPTISVGVDFNKKYFDKIYGYVCGGSVCPREYFQMLFRVRIVNNTNILVLCNKSLSWKMWSEIQPFHEIKENLGDKKINAFIHIKLWNKWESNAKSVAFLNVFDYYAKKKGFQFKLHDKDEYVKFSSYGGVDAPAFYYKDNDNDNEDDEKDEKVNYNIKNIYTAKDINSDDFEAIREKCKKANATRDEKFSIEKFVYYTKFKLNKDIDQDTFKKYYRKLHILKGFCYQFYNKLNEKNMCDKIDYNLKKNDVCNDNNNDELEFGIEKNKHECNDNCKHKLEALEKYKIFNNIQYSISTLDNKYLGNNFDKKVIAIKYNYYNKLVDIIGVRNKEIKREELIDQLPKTKDIFNDAKFRASFGTSTIENINNDDGSVNTLLLIQRLNTVFNSFGYKLETIKHGKTMKDRTYTYKLNLMDIIPKHYNDFIDFANKNLNDNKYEDNMEGFDKLIKDKSDKKKTTKHKKNNNKEFVVEF